MDAADASSLNTSSEAMAELVGTEVGQGNNAILLAGNAFDAVKQSVATLRVSVRSSCSAPLRWSTGFVSPAAST